MDNNANNLQSGGKENVPFPYTNVKDNTASFLPGPIEELDQTSLIDMFLNLDNPEALSAALLYTVQPSSNDLSNVGANAVDSASHVSILNASVP